MEMAGKHSDHYFCRWQAKIVTTIKFFLEKNEKVLRIAWFGEKIDQKNILKMTEEHCWLAEERGYMIEECSYMVEERGYTVEERSYMAEELGYMMQWF